MTSLRLAALDFGSNTAGHLIADWSAGEALPRILQRRSRFVRLAEGIARTGRLDDAAVRRALEWLREMKRDLDDAEVQCVRAVTTEALRRVTDGGRFLEPAAEILGAPVVLLSGDEEGRCCFRGVRLRYPEGPLAVLDIGGGSTECYTAPAGVTLGPQLVGFSTALGAVTLAEECGEDRARLADRVRRSWQRARAALPALPVHDRTLTVLGGTATNCALLHRGERSLPDEAIEGLMLDLTTVDRLAEQVAATPVEQRERELGIPAGRADVAVAGFEILLGAMSEFGFEKVRASRYCLRHGVLVDLRNGFREMQDRY